MLGADNLSDVTSGISGASRLRVALLSLLGIIGGHYATFWLMAPDGHARSGLLATTGHGSWTLPAYMATALAVALTFSALGGRLHQRSRLLAAPILIGIQCLGFAALEVAERSVAHGLALGILNDTALWLGIAIQLVIAIVAPLLFRFVGRSIERLLARFRAARSEQPGLIDTFCHHVDLITTLLRNTRWLRGPPALLLHR